MSEAIIVAFITGGLTLIGTILTVLMSTRKTEENLRISQAVTDTKIDQLTEEVKKHNHFAERLPVVEEQIKVINHRLEDLEKEKAV